MDTSDAHECAWYRWTMDLVVDACPNTWKPCVCGANKKSLPLKVKLNKNQDHKKNNRFGNVYFLPTDEMKKSFFNTQYSYFTFHRLKKEEKDRQVQE